MKVLIADDDLVSRMLLSEVLARLGYECRTTEDGEAAWEQFQEWLPDVLITDRMMPGMDGLELTRRVREHGTSSYTYVVLVTGLGEQADVRLGMRSGADDYLTKPIDPFNLETRLIAALRVTSLHAELETARGELQRLARTDPLTGLLNRQTMEADLATLHATSVRHGRRYALAMCDVDHFKALNDASGHPAGDAVLRTLGATFRAQARSSDRIYRYGGEEFLLVMPEEHPSGARIAVERFRWSVGALGLPHPSNPGGSVTMSAGVAGFDPARRPRSAKEVLAGADAALYQAKTQGRDRTVMAEDAKG